MKEFANIQRTCCSLILRNVGTLITCTMLPTSLGSVLMKKTWYPRRASTPAQKFIRTWRMFWKRNYRTVRRTTLVFLDYYAVFLLDFFGNIVCLLQKIVLKDPLYFFFSKVVSDGASSKVFCSCHPFICFCLSGRFPRILCSEVKIMRGCLQADIANLQSAKQSFIFSRSKNLFYFLWTLD